MLVDKYLDAVDYEKQVRKKLDGVCKFLFKTYVAQRYSNHSSLIKQMVVHRSKIHDDYIEFIVDVNIENMKKQQARKVSQNFFIDRNIINLTEETLDVPTILSKTTKEQEKKNRSFWMALEEKVYIFTKNKLQKKG